LLKKYKKVCAGFTDRFACYSFRYSSASFTTLAAISMVTSRATLTNH